MKGVAGCLSRRFLSPDKGEAYWLFAMRISRDLSGRGFCVPVAGRRRLVEGAHLEEWEKLVGKWKEEMHYVRMHRHARKA